MNKNLFKTSAVAILALVSFVLTAQDCPAPTNLSAEATDSYILLSWTAPENESAVDLSWSGTYNNNGVGTGSAADFCCAHKWASSELSNYVGWKLVSISFTPHQTTSAFAIRTWTSTTATPANLVLDQTVGTVTAGTMNTVTLESNVYIEANLNFWFGYRAQPTTGHPAGVDAGPALTGQGDAMLFNGEWTTLSDLGLNYNWCIVATVEDEGGKTANLVLSDGKMNETTGTFSAENNNVLSVAKAQSIQRGPKSVYTNFNIYRDGSLLVEDFQGTSYIDANLEEGTYCYTVTTLCGTGNESNPSNEACADIAGSCSSPTGLSAVADSPNVLVSWMASASANKELSHCAEPSDFYGMTNENSNSYALRMHSYELSSLAGAYITNVSFALGVSLDSYVVRIWEGSPDALTLVYEQPITGVIIAQYWNDVLLTEPYQIDGTKDVWIGYTAGTVPGSTYLFGVDEGTPFFNDASYVISGTTPMELSSIGLSKNLCIKAFAEVDGITYNVYRDGVKVANNIDALTYLDENLTSGHYCYTATTNCVNGESDPSNESCANVTNVGIETANSDFSVAPHPANNNVRIAGDNMESVMIYNALGQVVETVRVSGNTVNVNTGNYAAGVYSIRIQTVNGTAVSKQLVVTH